MSDDRPTALLLTALSLEARAVSAHLDPVETRSHSKGTVYEIGDFDGTWRIILVETGPGTPSVAVELERAAEFFEPDIALFVGIAGGLKDVRLGDVVAVTRVHALESGKVGRDGFEPRAIGGESTYSLVQLAKFVAREGAWINRIIQPDTHSGFLRDSGNRPRALVGPVVAGEKVIANTDSPEFRLIRSQYGDALAVEMEGYGFSRAAYAQNALPAMVVRGISDLIDEKQRADAEGFQPIAASHAAAFAFDLLTYYSPDADDAPLRGLTDVQLGSSDGPGQLNQLADLASTLFPAGPSQDAVWQRAGGDVSTIQLRGNGRAQWFWALSRLERGGGGSDISFRSLLRVFREEFPKNAIVQRLWADL